MKGTPRPTWTTGRHAWLRKLKAQGGARPRGTGEGSVATYCRALGWTAVHPPAGHTLTTEGLAVLERWESGDTSTPKAPAKPKARGLDLATATPLELADWLCGLGREHAQAVRDALDLVLEPAPAPAPTFAEAPRDAAPPVDDDQPVEAPQFGVRRPMVATLGLRVTPKGYTDCLCCSGRGTVRHGFQCGPCKGSGKIERTVEL